MTNRERERFAEHASAGAIRELLKNARTAQAKAENYTDWLENLLDQRTRQAEAGTWPPELETKSQ